MDADYLKRNVSVALQEALASMAIALPDDGVDYIGKYLLQYAQRKGEMSKVKYLLFWLNIFFIFTI